MTFDSRDSLLLYSIFICEGGKKGADLTLVISFIDYVDRSILEYSELTTTLQKLIPAKIVTQRGKKLFTKTVYKNWLNEKFKGKKRISANKALDQTLLFLNTTYSHIQAPAVPPKLNITMTDHDKAVKEYRVRMDKVIAKIK